MFNKALNVNEEFLDYHPASKLWVAKVDCRECVLCGYQQAVENKLCQMCGAPNLRFTSKGQAIYPPTKGSVAHYLRPVKYCWNEILNPETGVYTGHALDMKVRLVVDVAKEEAYDENYCAGCDSPYTWTNGKHASPQQLQDARDGKIPAPARSRAPPFKG